MALLHMLKAISDSFGFHLVVAHLNHCLRPEADHEEAEVRKLAESWSFPFESGSVDIRHLKKARGISEEEAGRLARYDLFFAAARKHNAAKIALGHHLDDQAETVLLNILRGTGVDGLAGILPSYKRGGVTLVRPLLCLRRHEIEAYCRNHNLYPFTDSSNLETDYTRNKLRLELIPRLEKEYNPRIREALYGLAALAFEDRRFLHALARKKYLALAGVGRREIFFKRKELSTLPASLSSRILRMAHKRFAPSRELDRFHIKQICDLAKSNKTTGQITLPGNVNLYLTQEHLILAGGLNNKVEAPFQKYLKVPGKTLLPGGSLVEARVVNKEDLHWPPSKYQAYLDYERIPAGNLKIRTRWPGARFQPQGSPGWKKLKDFFIDQKIPRYRRDHLPLVTAGDEIVWVVGLRIAQPYRVTGDTRRVLVLSFKKMRMPG